METAINPKTAGSAPRPAAADSLLFSEEDNIDDMYLTFGLGNEEYGVGIAYVTEVVGMQRIMEVPDVPGFIMGVINLRGKVIPVMDVRARFNMQTHAYSERTVIIVLEVERVPVGLIVDFVSDVLELPPAQIEHAKQFGTESQSVVHGFAKSGDKIVVLLDIERLVSRQAITLPSSSEA